MKLSLKKSEAIQREIDSAIKKIDLVGAANVSVFDENVEKTVFERHVALSSNYARVEALLDAKEEIRNSVYSANHNTGLYKIRINVTNYIDLSEQTVATLNEEVLL